MPMKLSEFNRLRKLMMLTHSGNDHEALSALRKANEVLKSHGYDWSSAFDRLVKVESDPYDYGGDGGEPPKPQRAEADEIRSAFEAVEKSDPRGSFADFIASIRDQFDRRGSLSARQKESLYSAARREGWRP